VRRIVTISTPRGPLDFHLLGEFTLLDDELVAPRSFEVAKCMHCFAVIERGNMNQHAAWHHVNATLAIF